MTAATVIIAVTIAAYLLVTVGIGVWFGRRGSGAGTENFYLGGRRLGTLVTAMSAEASDMSSYLLMGIPGLAYLAGIAEVSWTVIGLVAGTYLNWLLVARRIRRYSAALGAITVPDYIARRYDDQRHVLSLIAALVILVFFIPYTASGFKAVGTLFSALFGTEYHTAMILGAAVIVLYTVLGGFLAVSMTDLIQSIFMTLALIAVVVFGIGAAGGVGAVADNAKALPGYLALTQGYDAATGTAGTFGFLSVVSTLAWGLGYFGMPHILLRFMAAKEEKRIAVSRRIASVWVVVSMSVAVLVGIIGLAASANGAIDRLEGASASETVIIRLAQLMSTNGVLFAVAAGIILAGILAATMSTADSQLLAASSSMSVDLLQHFFGVGLSKKTAMLAARGTVIGIALIALILAWDPDSSVFRVVSFAWAGFGAAFGPVILLSLFWRRSNRQGALAGMICGGATVFAWKFLIAPIGGAFAIYELLPAFIAALIADIAVSLATAAPEKSVTDVFDSVKAG